MLNNEATPDDLFSFFDPQGENCIAFAEFQQMLAFYKLHLSFDRGVRVFSRAAGDKGYVDKHTFPTLMEEISYLCVETSLEQLGLTTLMIAMATGSLVIFLGAGLLFILFGVAGFSNNSDLAAVASSFLPMSFGASAKPKQDLSKVKQEGSAALDDAFNAITA